MARRGTNMKDLTSGSTFQTNPSGTTIDYQGVVATQFTDGISTLDATDLLNLASIAGPAIGATSVASILMSGDITNWAGASLEISTGLTTIKSFVGNYRIDTVVDNLSAVSTVMAARWIVSATAGIVTAALYSQANVPGTLTITPTGGSIAWIALGT